jgi:hypothetical protein
MIHSTISSSEADATQHQVDRLFGILQQTLNDTIQWIASRKPQQTDKEEILRIWMGNGKDGRILRQVYGPLANGENRNDLTPERLRSILDALQEPATEGIDPTLYAKRKPAIEIKIGDTTLFRQERDGVVTVNQIQLQRQNQKESEQQAVVSDGQQSTIAETSDSSTEATGRSPEVEPEKIAQDIAQTARYLLNPFGEAQHPLLTKARFQNFTLDYDANTDSLTIHRGQQPIVREQAGQVENLGATAADWRVFNSLNERILNVSPTQENVGREQPTAVQPAQASSPRLQAAQVADRQLARLAHQPLQTFFGRILHGAATWLNQTLENWQLATVAHTASQAFQQGYDRTGESAYQVGDFRVSQQQGNLFLLSDRTGGLLQFQNLPRGVKVVAASDRLTQPSIRNAINQLSSMLPEGNHETDYAFRVREAEQTVRDFLTYMKTSVWDYEQGRFRLEMIDNQVLITSKQDRRGQIHGPAKVMQKNHREKLVGQPTRLTWKDLDHLDSVRERLNARIQAAQAQQPKTPQFIPVSLASSNGRSHQVSQRSSQKQNGRELE